MLNCYQCHSSFAMSEMIGSGQSSFNLPIFSPFFLKLLFVCLLTCFYFHLTSGRKCNQFIYRSYLPPRTAHHNIFVLVEYGILHPYMLLVVYYQFSTRYIPIHQRKQLKSQRSKQKTQQGPPSLIIIQSSLLKVRTVGILEFTGL